MIHQDIGRPEQELFLLDAADAMRAYHTRQGVYAARWHQLAMTFAAELYHFGDPDVRPPVEGRERWRPRGCDLTYVIQAADAEDYRIEAVDDAGTALYAIGKDGMIERLGGNAKPMTTARYRVSREGDDPTALALHMVWEGAHGVYRDEHPGAGGNSVAEELYANANLLDFYEELRGRGNLDRELERRRTARLAGRLREDVISRYPDLPDHQ